MSSLFHIELQKHFPQKFVRLKQNLKNKIRICRSKTTGARRIELAAWSVTGSAMARFNPNFFIVTSSLILMTNNPDAMLSY